MHRRTAAIPAGAHSIHGVLHAVTVTKSAALEGDKFIISVMRNPDYPVRIVTKNERGFWCCECNLYIYKGIVCRHTMRVLVDEGLALSQFGVNSRWWKSQLQPKIELICGSPFKGQIIDSGLKPSVPILEGTVTMNKASATQDTIQEGDVGVLMDENMGGFNSGNDSGGAASLYYLQGAPLAIPLQPKELQNEVRSEMHSMVTQIGTNIDKLTSFRVAMNSWAQGNLGTHDVSMPLQVVRNRGSHFGAPTDKVGLKAPKVKPRANGVRSKKQYACSICGKIGHTKAKCSKKKRSQGNDEIRTVGADIAGVDGHRVQRHTKAKKAKLGESDDVGESDDDVDV